MQTYNNFAETPKDGNWHKIPGIVADLSEYIRWEPQYSRWDWIMLKDDVAVVEAYYIPEMEIKQ